MSLNVRVHQTYLDCEECGGTNKVHSHNDTCVTCEQRATREREECPTCKQYRGQMMPPHFASARCESGQRPHCTCDVCF